MVAQLLGATFFAGTRRGIQVPLNAASYVAWGYRGLVNNEFADSDHTWTCTVWALAVQAWLRHCQG